MKHHDSLWKIAGMGSVYGDNFKWPLLFIANRDKIHDPDIIKPEWSLVVKTDWPKEKMDDAVAKAKETGPYVPHTTEREKLPIEY